jgi:ABC-type sugar transport system substrate-binding protein
MKKALSILLAVFLALTLFSCNKKSAAGGAQESKEPGLSENIWEPGFYNPKEEYTKNQRYKVVYMLFQNGVLYDMFDKAFTQWAEKANCDYSVWCANNDADQFVNSIETFASQGVNGILSDADMTIYNRVNDVMKDLKMPWMPVMGAPRADGTGTLLHAYCGFDFYMYGAMMANWVIDYYQKTWPEATLDKTAMLCLDFSISDNLHVRIDAAKDVWNERYPGNEDKFLVADGASAARLDSDTGYNISGPVISAHPEVEYWIVCGLLDDYADGCARALEAAGKDDHAVITVMGGSGLINHWDAGEESCWKSACYTAETVYSEPIFFGLYYQMTGQITSEKLWPEWINKGAGETYASLLLPSFFITKDTYKEYMEWCDAYTGINRSNYEYHGTQYSARLEVPTSFKGA